MLNVAIQAHTGIPGSASFSHHYKSQGNKYTTVKGHCKIAKTHKQTKTLKPTVLDTALHRSISSDLL